MDCLPGQRGSVHRNPLQANKTDKERARDTTARSDKDVRNAPAPAPVVEVLPTCKLRFSSDQLRALNYQLGKLVESRDGLEHTARQAETIVERLTQRLLCAVGNLDPRFSSCFLVTLPDTRTNASRSNLEYIVRLDTLSTPLLYPNDVTPSYEILEYDSDSTSPGYARIRLRNKTSTNWAEFINASGYLRRDKIQERFVELLALAAAGEWPISPLECDESTLCAAPGKVLDAATLTHVLRSASDQRVFYGAAANNLRFPDPRDFRLAIVDEPAGVRLRVGFLSPSLAGHDVEVRLVIALGVDAWPKTSNFPGRVHLGHGQCLLYHRGADMGMYLGAIGTQSINWQIMLPATEETLLQHYGTKSTETAVLQTLYTILDDVHSKIVEDKCKYSCKLVTRRSAREVLWSVLEDDNSNPLSVMLDWTSGHKSKHVLRLLDRLVGSLRCQSQPSYFFPNSNLLENPGNAKEEDYYVEANRIFMYMVRLHNDAQCSITDSAFIRLNKYAEIDAALVSRWSDVVIGLMPPAATRSSRFSFASAGITSSNGRRSREASVAYTQYTGRQLEYIGLLLKSMLDVKQNIVQITNSSQDFETSFHIPEDPIEDVIYLLVTIIEQARDQCLNHNKQTGKSTKYHTKTRSQFNAATAKLVAAVRKDRKKDQRDLSSIDFMQDSLLVKAVLRWLYKGLDQSKHNLAPVLRPYLNKLFVSSHEISWHLDGVRQQRDEIEALGAFNRLVNTTEVSPASGLIESVNKGWNWARNMLRLVERGSLRIVFTPDRNKLYRHILKLPSYEKRQDSPIANGLKSLQGTLKERKIGEEGTSRTLPSRRFQEFFYSGDYDNCPVALSRTWRSTSNMNALTIISHQELKASSPMTDTFRAVQLQGRHRCPDDLVISLASLNKISILQELSNILLPEDRHDMLDTIQKLSKENKRQAALRRRCTLPPLHSSPSTSAILYTPSKSLLRRTRRKTSLPQTYTPTDENTAYVKENTTNSSDKFDTCTETHDMNDIKDEINFDELKDDDDAMILRTQNVLKEREKALARKIAKETLIGSCRAARIKEDSQEMFHENFKIKRLFHQAEYST